MRIIYCIAALSLLLVMTACFNQAQAVDLQISDTPISDDPEGDAGPADGTANDPGVEGDTVAEDDGLPAEGDDPDIAEESGVIDYQAVKPNEIGNIMIIMYHGVAEEDPGPYDRKTADFINDLEIMYKKGYRPISLRDLVTGNITVEAGYTPIVLTFDDGKASAFSLVEEDGELAPTPGCVVDILDRFSEEHPGFGKAACFFVNGKYGAFMGAGTLEERYQYLADNGYDLGNHTYSHPHLNKMNDKQIQEEIGRMDQLIRSLLPDYEPVMLAYPHGVRPKENLRPYALAGEYNGHPYEYPWALREGQSIISANPNHVAFDPLNVPRVRGTDDSTPDFDVQDLGYFFRFYDENPERRYISDGNPDRIAVPEKLEHWVNKDSLGDKELFIY